MMIVHAVPSSAQPQQDRRGVVALLEARKSAPFGIGFLDGAQLLAQRFEAFFLRRVDQLPAHHKRRNRWPAPGIRPSPDSTSVPRRCGDDACTRHDRRRARPGENSQPPGRVFDLVPRGADMRQKLGARQRPLPGASPLASAISLQPAALRPRACRMPRRRSRRPRPGRKTNAAQSPNHNASKPLLLHDTNIIEATGISYFSLGGRLRSPAKDFSASASAWRSASFGASPSRRCAISRRAPKCAIQAASLGPGSSILAQPGGAVEHHGVAFLHGEGVFVRLGRIGGKRVGNREVRRSSTGRRLHRLLETLGERELRRR